MPLTDRKYTIGLAYGTGTADRTGAALDMSGFQEVDMIVQCAAIHDSATYSIKAQGAVDSAFGTPVDIAGTSQVIAGDDDSQVFIINMQNAPYRYVRVYVDKDATNACAETVTYVQHGPSRKPQTADTTNAVTTEAHVWPIAGTA
jgi:hypothetical protein